MKVKLNATERRIVLEGERQIRGLLSGVPVKFKKFTWHHVNWWAAVQVGVLLKHIRDGTHRPARRGEVSR